MKFTTLVQSFATLAFFASANAATDKPNLRNGVFVEAKPATRDCYSGASYCSCRDGSECWETSDCVDRGVGGSCSARQEDNTRSGNAMACRDGASCFDGNTACADGSKCKPRSEEELAAFNRELEAPEEYVEAQPETVQCRTGQQFCTCRDGTPCFRTTQCTNRGLSGSCSFRPQNRNSNQSCRNGESCIKHNTACLDGSACRERNEPPFEADTEDSESVAVNRELEAPEEFVGAKPTTLDCYVGASYCSCRDGSECWETNDCIDRGVGGSCSARQADNTRSGNAMACRDGASCFDGNTACADGSKCKPRSEEEFAAFNRELEAPEEFVGAKPATIECLAGQNGCTCRDGTPCRATSQCSNRGLNGSCSYRPANRNSRKSCRNGESCIDNNTACLDGSACRERASFLSFE